MGFKKRPCRCRPLPVQSRRLCSRLFVPCCTADCARRSALFSEGAHGPESLSLFGALFSEPGQLPAIRLKIRRELCPKLLLLLLKLEKLFPGLGSSFEQVVYPPR